MASSKVAIESTTVACKRVTTKLSIITVVSTLNPAVLYCTTSKTRLTYATYAISLHPVGPPFWWVLVVTELGQVKWNIRPLPYPSSTHLLSHQNYKLGERNVGRTKDRGHDGDESPDAIFCHLDDGTEELGRENHLVTHHSLTPLHQQPAGNTDIVLLRRDCTGPDSIHWQDRRPQQRSHRHSADEPSHTGC